MLLFVLAGLCEIGGYLVWLWLREGRAVWLGAIGGLMLFLYGVLPTLQPAEASFGRVYAAYGGTFVVLSLAWDWWIDGVRPDRWDLLRTAVWSTTNSGSLLDQSLRCNEFLRRAHHRR